MEKIKETVKEVKDTEHFFYCDECGKYLGSSKEYDDGWYQKLGEFELKIYIDNWYRLKKCLCDDCKYRILENLKIDLGVLGFKKE